MRLSAYFSGPQRRSLALELLQLLPHESRPARISDLAHDLGIEAVRVPGLMATLRHEGFDVDFTKSRKCAYIAGQGWKIAQYAANRAGAGLTVITPKMARKNIEIIEFIESN